MDADYALNWLDSLFLDKTGHRLSDLQRLILIQVWQGRKYFEIAVDYGCTEGHAKDVGSQLWKSLSEILGEKITKQNCRSVTERCLRKARSLKHKIGSTFEQWRLTASEPSRIEKHNLSQYWSNIHFHNSPDSATEKALRFHLDIPNFVGRDEAITHLCKLVHKGHRIVVIQGEGGLGKTTLAQQFLAQQHFEVMLELFIAQEPQNITPAERVVEEWLTQDLGIEPGMDFGISLSRLRRQLRSRSIGVLIDNLETLLEGEGCFIAAHRNYSELFRMLGDENVQSITLVTSRDRLCEPGVHLAHYRLPGLDRTAWMGFFQHQLHSICLDTLHAMHHAYGGNAKVMKLLCGVIQTDFGGEMRAYWRHHQKDLLSAPGLQNLVSSQADRLQDLDINAFQLFCRLGCYRYQTIPALPIEGVLALLWDVPSHQHYRVITALSNRSLVECENGYYSLHPAVKTEAISRLRGSPDWERTNQEAANFWSQHVQCITNRQDALHAFEAFYHYIAIHDAVSAGNVILQSRINQWNQFLPLGSTLYRLGLVCPVFNAIAQVTQRLESLHLITDQLGELYNIWGDLHWIIGNVHDAIACQHKTIQITTHQLQDVQETTASEKSHHQLYYLNMLTVDSILSMGLYHIDLWELKNAEAQFNQVIRQAQHTRHHAWAEKAMVCLAFVKAVQGEQSPSYHFANRVYETLLHTPNDSVGRVAYFLQILGQTYGLIGDISKAEHLLNRSLTASKQGHYLQIQGRTLSSLGAIARHQENYETALAYHTNAIQGLEKIGAVCDLAEAHIQIGLTYQQIDHVENSHNHFKHAITLFQKISAPKQVQRTINLFP